MLALALAIRKLPSIGQSAVARWPPFATAGTTTALWRVNLLVPLMVPTAAATTTAAGEHHRSRHCVRVRARMPSTTQCTGLCVLMETK